MISVQTITTATPSVAPPPLRRHVVERVPDPDQALGPFKPDEFKDLALCDFMWDTLSPRGEGEVCDECLAELRRRGGAL